MPYFSPEQVLQTFPSFKPFWKDHAAFQTLWHFLCQAHPDVRLVGGCVRDALLGRTTQDIDLGTPLPPDPMLAYLRQQGYAVLTMGIDFGSLRVCLEDLHVDITTLRHDLQTDGRWAKVGYTARWEEDAQRRDFTINALSMNSKGVLFDPTQGVEHLKARRVCFIGDANQRIQEDVLRMLRFLRFHQYYGQGPLDPEGAEACLSHASSLKRLSGERIWHELQRILNGPDLFKTLKHVNDLHFDQALWGCALNMQALSVWQHLLHEYPLHQPYQDPFRAFLLGWTLTPADITQLRETCAWPKRLKKRLERLLTPSFKMTHPCALPHLDTPQTLEEAYDGWALHAVTQILKQAWPPEEAIVFLTHQHDTLQFLKRHPLPLTGQTLLDQGIPPHKIKQHLEHARRLWMHNPQLTPSEILIYLNHEENI